MPELSNLHVRITATDEVTPVLRRIRRELWWMRHGETVAVAIVAAAAFVVGLVTGVQF